MGFNLSTLPNLDFIFLMRRFIYRRSNGSISVICCMVSRLDFMFRFWKQFRTFRTDICFHLTSLFIRTCSFVQRSSTWKQIHMSRDSQRSHAVWAVFEQGKQCEHKRQTISFEFLHCVRKHCLNRCPRQMFQIIAERKICKVYIKNAWLMICHTFSSDVANWLFHK